MNKFKLENDTQNKINKFIQIIKSLKIKYTSLRLCLQPPLLLSRLLLFRSVLVGDCPETLYRPGGLEPVLIDETPGPIHWRLAGFRARGFGLASVRK